MRRALYVVAVVVLAACSGGDSSQPAPSSTEGQASAPADQAPPPPPARKTLPDARVVAATEIDTTKLQKVDLGQLRSNGTLQIEVNDPAMKDHLAFLLDGDTETLSRTGQLNPLIVTLTFSQPVSVKAVRLFPTYSTYDWAVEVTPGADRLMVQNAAHNAWSGIALDSPIETSIIRIEVLRLERDDNVHLNEIEIYG